MGDEIELAAVERLFGNAAGKVVHVLDRSRRWGICSERRGRLRPLLGAAIRDQVAPPTLNLDNPSVTTAIDLVPHRAKKRTIDTVLSNSLGLAAPMPR